MGDGRAGAAVDEGAGRVTAVGEGRAAMAVVMGRAAMAVGGVGAVGDEGGTIEIIFVSTVGVPFRMVTVTVKVSVTVLFGAVYSGPALEGIANVPYCALHSYVISPCLHSFIDMSTLKVFLSL